MSISRIKTKDTVIVIAGEDSGKTGTVLRIDQAKGRAFVEGLNLVKKTIRRSQQHPDGAIIDKEASIALSNLMPYDPKQKKGVRVSHVREGGKTVREAKGSGHRFE
jgi:large subunit ribosomal protein L24